MTSTHRRTSATRNHRRLAVAAIAAGWTLVVAPGAFAQTDEPVVFTKAAVEAAERSDVVLNKAAVEYAERQAVTSDQVQPASQAQSLTATAGLDIMSGAGGLALGALLGAGAMAMVVQSRRAHTPRTT